MSQDQKYQVYDAAVARIARRLSDKFSFITKVNCIDAVISELAELKEVLIDARAVAKAGEHPGDTRVRLGKFLPHNRNSTTRRGVGPMTGVKKPLQPKTSRRSKSKTSRRSKAPQQSEALRIIKRWGRAFHSGEIAKKMGISSTNSCQLLETLQEKGELKRRKAKKSEIPHSNVRYMYELVA